jgi:hypothetical protein
MIDPFQTNDHKRLEETEARRFAYAAMKALETADAIEIGIYTVIKMRAGFAVLKTKRKGEQDV